MSDIDFNDRGALLEAFQPTVKANLPAPAQAFGLPTERPMGAQAVAVYRDDARVLQKVKAMAAAAGQDWYYRFPVKNRREGRTDYIEGPSIKLANDLARMYGNCEVDTRVQDAGAEWMIYARFTDIETGFTMTRPFQQRKKQGSIGGGDEARALDIALQIGVSKAIRNVIVNALQTFADFAFDEARNALVDKIGKQLPQYRDRVVGRLKDKKIDLKRVDAVIGRPSAEWLAPDVARVIAMVKAIEDGMATLDETFPLPGSEKLQDEVPKGSAPRTLTSKLDALASGMDAAKPSETKPAETQRAEVVPADEVEMPVGDVAPADQDVSQAEDDAPADPRETLLGEIRSEIINGGRKVLAILNALGERRSLLTDDDVAGLKKAEKDFAQNAGARP